MKRIITGLILPAFLLALILVSWFLPRRAAAQSTPSASFAWDAGIDTTLNGYNIYRSTASQTYGKTPLNGSLIKTEAYTDSTVVRGTTYYYVVTSVTTDNLESFWSNEVTVTIPAMKPAAPTNLKAGAITP